jgi:uncharacterized membrane protein
MTKTIKIIFTLSILLNLTLVGFVGADYYKKSEHHRMPFVMDENTHELVKKLKPSREEMKQRMKEARESRKVLKSIIQAKEFDLNAYQNAMNKIMDQKDEMARARVNKMGETLSQLSQEDRISLSNHMIKKLSGQERGGRPHKDKRQKHSKSVER